MRNKIILTRISTPLGNMIAGSVKEGICLLEFEDRDSLSLEIKQLEKYLEAGAEEGSSPHTSILKSELNDYFSATADKTGRLKRFSVPLVTPGSGFQQKVWQALCKIPYGETRTYLEQAKMLGCPESVRAVANANGQNRISIIIPCHRVIGSNGKLTGYGGGLHRKKWLLEHESRHCKIPKGLF